VSHWHDIGPVPLTSSRVLSTVGGCPTYFYFAVSWSRGVDLYGTGGHTCPQYLWRGTVHGNVPQYFRSDVVIGCRLDWAQETMSRSPRKVDNSNNCCLLYLNANIMCSFTKKSFSFWGTSSPRLPTGSPLLDPGRGLPSSRPPVFFYVPPIILWDRRPWVEGLAFLAKRSACPRVKRITLRGYSIRQIWIRIPWMY